MAGASDRAKSYLWLLTVLMGVSLTNGVKEFVSFVVSPPSPSPGTVSTSVFAATVRFGIFILLAFRWASGTFWYFDKAYVSQKLNTLPPDYFWDLFVAFVNFLVFVPLALTITHPSTVESHVSLWLNTHLLGGKHISTFIWIFSILLIGDVLWVLMFLLFGLCKFTKLPSRTKVFWMGLNLLTLALSGVAFFFYGFMGWNLEEAEWLIFVFILVASIIDVAVIFFEDIKLSQWIAPIFETTSPPRRRKKRK